MKFNGDEKKSLSLSLSVCLCLSVSLFLSYTLACKTVKQIHSLDRNALYISISEKSTELAINLTRQGYVDMHHTSLTHNVAEIPD